MASKKTTKKPAKKQVKKSTKKYVPKKFIRAENGELVLEAIPQLPKVDEVEGVKQLDGGIVVIDPNKDSDDK